MFDECPCHDSPLWKDGPVNLELCHWTIISTSVPLALLLITIPVHILNIIAHRRVFSISGSWTKLNMVRIAMTAVIMILNILYSMKEVRIEVDKF